jgi:hypothetical protein
MMFRMQFRKSVGRKPVQMLDLQYFDAAYTIAANGALLSEFLRRLGGWGLH